MTGGCLPPRRRTVKQFTPGAFPVEKRLVAGGITWNDSEPETKETPR